MKISDLHHVTVGNQGQGPFVLVLEDGSVINAEDRAMLQSLYSRSPASVLDHLEKLVETGSGKFMDQYYVGYGHKSIGDCGSTTIFIEGVSMLVAKAIQDNMLYDGQEVSTRYLDFALQPFVDPLSFSEGNLLQEKFRKFYVEAMPKLIADLKVRFPMKETEKESVYEKAIAARAFDILRGFLPAGAETNLSWSTNLRQAADRISNLLVHPLDEVRQVAKMIDEALKKAHPNSFNHKRYAESDEYRENYMIKSYYFSPLRHEIHNEVVLKKNMLDEELFGVHAKTILSRPVKTELPKHLAEIGMLQFEFTLDFGSFRDIARQRAVIQRMPLLTPLYGFHMWYLDELPDELKKQAETLLLEVYPWWEEKIAKADDAEQIKYDLQYYIPMGFRVPCRITGDLPALVYLAELRSGVTVHATLREVAQNMAKFIEGLGVPIYIDRSEIGRFDVKRGNQDIVAK